MNLKFMVIIVVSQGEEGPEALNIKKKKKLPVLIVSQNNI